MMSLWADERHKHVLLGLVHSVKKKRHDADGHGCFTEHNLMRSENWSQFHLTGARCELWSSVRGGVWGSPDKPRLSP